MTIYVTGGSGRMGQELLKLLPEAVPLVRKKSGLKNEKITDFSAPELEKILVDADAVVHLAGSMNFLDAKELWETNVELTKRLVAATPKKARFVLASSISVYGKKLATVPADEKTAVRPDSPYSRSKLAAEEAVTKGNRNAVILRIGTVYGPGFEDYYRILSMIERGKMSLFGKGDNRISFVHVEDVVKAIAASIKPKVMPGIYVLAGESLPQKEIYAIAAEQLGVQVPRRTVHVPFALFFTWVEEHKARFGKRRPKLTAEHVHILASDRTFDCAKARKMLGFKPRPLEEGISEMVNEIRKK